MVDGTAASPRLCALDRRAAGDIAGSLEWLLPQTAVGSADAVCVRTAGLRHKGSFHNRSFCDTSPSDQAPPMQRAAINQLSNGIALRSRSCIVQRRRTSQKIVTWCPGRESHAITDTTNCCLSFAWWCERSAGWPGPCHAIFPSGRNLASRTPIGRRLFVLGGVG
jgi:hypothetical protein